MDIDGHYGLARGDANFSVGKLPAESFRELPEIKNKEKIMKLWNYSSNINSSYKNQNPKFYWRNYP
ncbi:MAG: hypothetical protein ACTSRZ_02720 [Promethearchaeota archaeon]